MSFQRIFIRHDCMIAAAALFAVACTPAQKRPVVATALDNTETRRESFEATLRELDEHPEYVDEFFEITLRHPKTLDRLFWNNAQHAHHEPLARLNAERLVDAPPGLKTVLIATLDASQDRQQALEATAEAIESRPALTVRALVQRERALRRTMHELLAVAQRDPAVQRAFLAAMMEDRQAVANVLASDPEVMGALFKALGGVGLRRGQSELESFLSALDD
jgi:hypothetical protein